jgi:hypothetical protein
MLRIDRDSLMAYCLETRNKELRRSDIAQEKAQRASAKKSSKTYLPKSPEM